MCLGLLAYEPDYFYFKHGKFISYEKEKNPYKKVFQFCALETGNIMDKIALELGDNFVFYWVDGVYLRKKT